MAGNPIHSEIVEKYGNKVRLRVCGLCWRNDSLLLVNHKFLTEGAFWAPPGGGVEFGQLAEEALIREFKEETSITIQVGKLLFACEFIKQPLHAVELFFEAFHLEGTPRVGTDPESTSSNQIIKDVSYLDYKTILELPATERHGIFRFAKTADEVRKLSGFYRI